MGIGRTATRYAWFSSALVLVLLSWPRETRAQARADWQRGLLIASAAAPADLRAPSTELARVKAERVARRRCYEQLREAAAKLPLASGKRVSAALEQPLPPEGMGLISLASDQGSDGSVVVRMALPIDSLRTQVYGADTPIQGEATANSVLLLDARSVKMTPSIGLAIRANGAEYRGPVLFFKDEAVARADVRVGKDAALVPVIKMKAGVMHVDAATIEPQFVEHPLVVVLYREGK